MMHTPSFDSRPRPSLRPAAALALVVATLTIFAGNAGAAPPAKFGKAARAAYLRLAGTDVFADDHVGYSGDLSDNVVAFRVLLAHPEARAAFTHLLRDGKDAGKLYALAGLWHVDRPAFGRAAAVMARSTARVKREAGCDTFEESVAEIVDAGHTSVRIQPGETLIDALQARGSGPIDLLGGGYPVTFAGENVRAR